MVSQLLRRFPFRSIPFYLDIVVVIVVVIVAAKTVGSLYSIYTFEILSLSTEMFTNTHIKRIEWL